VTRSGRTFYAVDLRGAGRSLRSGDVPHFMRSVQEQGDGIGAAVDAVARLHPGLPVVVHGHSTGGLTAAIWAADRPHPALAALILDSPLLSGPRSRARRLLTPTLRPRAALRPGSTRRVGRRANRDCLANGGGGGGGVVDGLANKSQKACE